MSIFGSKNGNVIKAWIVILIAWSVNVRGAALQIKEFSDGFFSLSS